jgi:tagatose-6-phosphate ketose/aldose isomerase
LNEIRTKGVVRTIVAIGHADSTSDSSLYCEAFAKLDDAYRPAVDVIFSQMVGLFSSIELGLQPDSPSPNGVISRVVEKFAIYA